MCVEHGSACRGICVYGFGRVPIYSCTPIRRDIRVGTVIVPNACMPVADAFEASRIRTFSATTGGFLGEVGGGFAHAFDG